MSKDYLVFAAVLTTVAGLIAFDIVYDFLGGGSISHVAIESAVFIAAISGLGLVVKEYVALKREKASLITNLEQFSKDLEMWKGDAEGYLRGLSEAIDKQMARWNFTEAEKEIGLLILKGLSFKEIAAVRGTSERTVRQQSLDIYRKSGMTGRAEFSAFFLEDLLAPIRES